MRASSAALLDEARAGSPEAWEALCGHHAPRLLALIRLRMGPAIRARVESRDVLQVTLLKAVRGIGAFRGQTRDAFAAWLARIAANEVRDQADRLGRRRRAAAVETPLEDVPSGRLADTVRSQSSRILWDERRARLERALESLSAEHREVVILRKLEELSFAEIAARIERSPDACRMLLARAMTALTLAIEGER
jgi:RNA polymerase sigma-70 factor (ECF subfamily)